MVEHKLQTDSTPRQLAFHLLERITQVADHAERAGAELAEDGNVDLAFTVNPHDVGLDVVRILGRGHVLEVGGVPFLDPHRDVAHILDLLVHRVGIDHKVEVAELGVARGQEDVAGVERVHDIDRGEVAGLHLLAVEVGHDRPDLAAVDDRRDRPGLAHDHVADLIAAYVVEHRLVVRRVVAVHGHHAHGGGRGRVIRQHHWGKGAWRKVGNGRQGQRVHLGQGAVGVHIALEVIADDAGPKDRPRLLPRHAVGLAGPSLHPVGDVVRDARGRHPVVEGQRLNRRTPEDREEYRSGSRRC